MDLQFLEMKRKKPCSVSAAWPFIFFGKSRWGDA